MDRGMVIFVGALLTFTSSLLGLVVFPYWQLQPERAYSDPQGTGDAYPQPLAGKALAGRQVYVANGCMYCHSQQVRSERFGNWWEEGRERTGADVRRGWGARRTVSRDYIHDQPALLGTMRTGPDLAAVGPRYSEEWQLRHTFNPRAVNSWSIMPSFPFLYTREKLVGGPGSRSPRALNLGREWTVNPGYRWRPSDREWAATLGTQGDTLKRQLGIDADLATDAGRKQLLDFWLTTPEEDHQVVPTAEGEALVAYLLSLDKTAVPLPEAKE
jgi:cytochrome c oxidase cbb3-type subunit 2